VDDALRAELLELKDADQAFRQRMHEEYEAEAARTTRIREIVAAHGWPGRTLVGDDGASAAWLLVQHADDDPEFQDRALELMRAAVEAGEADAGELAYLTDRVRVAQSRPQVYGTQFGRTGPHPIEDPDALDERRAAVGLEPFGDYAARFPTARRAST
jgi:hypothetical protein